MNKETMENHTPDQILKDTISARIGIINEYLDMDHTDHLEKYFNAVNLEGLTDDDKKVLSNLIPGTIALIIPSELESHPQTHQLFNQLSKAETMAGTNLLLSQKNQTPADEEIKDSVASFRAFIVILQTLGVYNIRELTAEKLRNTLARMIVKTNYYPLPPEIKDHLSAEESQTLMIISKMHAQLNILTKPEYVKKEAEQKQRAIQYMNFISRYANMEGLTDFMLAPDGKAKPLKDKK